MERQKVERWRGLFTLVVDAVEHGSRAVEHVQKVNAGRTFAVLEAVPKVAAPAKVVHAIHDFSVVTTHATIRAVAGTIGEVAVLVLDRVADDAVKQG